MLYRLCPGLLALRSSVLDSPLPLPHQEHQKGAEGTCDENPILLHGVIRQEFDHLLKSLSGGCVQLPSITLYTYAPWSFTHYSSYAGEQRREELLVSVLKLSAFFDISHGFQYAIAELSRLSPFDPPLKLQLGRQCRMH